MKNIKHTEENTNEFNELKTENGLLKDENFELKKQLEWFKEQILLNKHRQFGQSSEKTQVMEQLSIFNEAEIEEKPDAPEPVLEEITYKRKKSVGQRQLQFEGLPTEVIEYRLSEEEQLCDCCGNSLHEMSKEVRKELEYIPASIKVIEHISYVYACRHCEKNDITTPIKTALMPNPPIKRSFASASLIAGVMNHKFVEALPLYRQEQGFDRLGIEISRQNMANWMIEASNRWLDPMYNELHKKLLTLDIAHADETVLQVLNEPDKTASSNSYMWLYRTGGYDKPIVLYDYQTSRAGKHAVNFLKGFKGYLHTDAYGGYNSLTNVRLVYCFAHARRKFDEALKALPKEAADRAVTAREGLEFCNKLFELERSFKPLSPEERYEKRQELSRPVLDAFLTWIKYYTPRVLPKSAFGMAIAYCRTNWDKLCNFLLDGRLEIDNNRAERSIKPFVIGRKNWLFANSQKGAKSSAIIYSIVETAKENNLIPYEYLKYLLEKLPNMDLDHKNTFELLMPWSDSLPDCCKMKIKD
jgi:transposase